MYDILIKIIFFVAVLPFLIVEKSYEMLNEYLEKHGRRKLEWSYVGLFFLIVLLLVLWAIGYR